MTLSTHEKSLLAQLRADIRTKHDHVEGLTEGNTLMASPSKEKYLQFLWNHYQFHQEVAHHIKIGQQQEPLVILDWPDCSRIKALKKDLTKLSPHAVNLEPSGNSLYKNSFFAMGLCYVVEGSSMGNKMILAQLEKHADFNEWDAKHFLVSSKENLAERWKTFQKVLVKALDANYDEVRKGSVYGFDLFESLWRANKVPW